MGNMMCHVPAEPGSGEFYSMDNSVSGLSEDEIATLCELKMCFVCGRATDRMEIFEHVIPSNTASPKLMPKEQIADLVKVDKMEAESCNSEDSVKADSGMFGVSMEGDLFALNRLNTREIVMKMEAEISNAAFNLEDLVNMEKLGVKLFEASIKGDLLELRNLISQGASISWKNEYGQTSVFVAAYQGQFGCVQHLIQFGADPGIPDNYGKTPLWAASRNGHLECVQFLVESETDPNITDNFGKTPLWEAAHHGHSSCVQCLIQHRANPSMSDSYGKTPLSAAAHNGHLECIEYLLQNGANFRTPDNYGTTPLWQAAHNGNLDCIECLVQHGADPDVPDSYGSTPLWEAANNGNLECIQCLIQCGADPNTPDSYGNTPLLTASFNGHLECVQYLVQNGADSNTSHSAIAFNSRLESAEYLVRKGADPSISNEYLVREGANPPISNKRKEIPNSVASNICFNYLKVERLIQDDVKTSILNESRNTSEFLEKTFDYLRREYESLDYKFDYIERNYGVSTASRKYFEQNARKIAVVLTVDDNRPGNDVDVERILELLPRWGYGEIINVRNATRDQMVQTFLDLQKVEGIYHGLLVFIGCAAVPGNILKTSDNRRVGLGELQELVNSTSAPVFSGVPKLFIVSTCPGDERVRLRIQSARKSDDVVGNDRMVLQQSAEAIFSLGRYEALGMSSIPSTMTRSEANFFTAYSTVDGLVNFRNAHEGTYFAQTLLDVWEKHFDDQSLQILMRKTRAKLLKKVTDRQVFEISETLVYPVIRGVYGLYEDES